MRFHSVHTALAWFARQHDGLRGTWSDPERVSFARQPGREQRHLVVFAIQRALAGLSEHQRRLLEAYYLKDVDVLTLAAEEQRHPSRVYHQLARARRALTVQLKAEGLLTELED